jgi:Condensation domain
MSRSSPETRIPLSFAWQRLWFLRQLEGTSGEYHVSEGFLLQGELNGDALRRALDALVARHTSLRRRRLGGADHQDARASPVRPSAMTGRAAHSFETDLQAGSGRPARQSAALRLFEDCRRSALPSPDAASSSRRLRRRSPRSRPPTASSRCSGRMHTVLSRPHPLSDVMVDCRPHSTSAGAAAGPGCEADRRQHRADVARVCAPCLHRAHPLSDVAGVHAEASAY